jgi:hypothetical protein
MKTITVNVQIQLDIRGKNDIIQEVQNQLDFINERIKDLSSEPQIFVNNVDKSDIN